MITFCTLTNKQEEESKSSHLSYHNLQIAARTISFYGEIMGAHGSITSQCPAHYVMETGSRHQTGPALMWLLTLSLCFNFIDLMSCCHAQCQSLATIKVSSLLLPGHEDRVKRRRQDGSGDQGNPSLFNLLVSSLVVAFILSL